MADVDLTELVQRVQALEMQAARGAGGAQLIRVHDTTHHPRPGAWTGDDPTAACRYCDRPITQDAPGSETPGQWRAGRDPRCHARAAGAPAKD